MLSNSEKNQKKPLPLRVQKTLETFYNDTSSFEYDISWPLTAEKQSQEVDGKRSLSEDRARNFESQNTMVIEKIQFPEKKTDILEGKNDEWEINHQLSDQFLQCKIKNGKSLSKKFFDVYIDDSPHFKRAKVLFEKDLSPMNIREMSADSTEATSLIESEGNETFEDISEVKKEQKEVIEITRGVKNLVISTDEEELINIYDEDEGSLTEQIFYC